MASNFHELMENGDTEGMQALLDQSFKASSLNAEQLDRLFNAALLPVSHSPQAKAKKEEIFQLLLQYDPDFLRCTDKYGYSFAHHLARFGYDTVLQDLIQQGRANELMIPEKKCGYAPIHSAIMNGKLTTVQLLLTIPDMANIKDWESRNIIHHAAHHGTEEMMRCCCEGCRAANNVSSLVIAEDKTGLTPAQLLLDFNTTGDVEAIMDILVSHGAERLSRVPTPFRLSPYR